MSGSRRFRQEYRPPSEDICAVTGFENETRVEVRGFEPLASTLRTSRSAN